MRPDQFIFFIAGALSMLNFAQTAWVYPNISRWFYVADGGFAVFYFLTAVFFAKSFAALSAANGTKP